MAGDKLVGLPGLPAELILNVLDVLDNNRDANALAQTTRGLYDVVNPELYRRDADSGNNKALAWAATEGQISTARMALAQGGNVDALVTEPYPGEVPAGPPRGITYPDHSPLRSGCYKMLSARPMSVLHAAIIYKHEELANFLIERGANLDTTILVDGAVFSSIHTASSLGLHSVVHLLLRKGVSADLPNELGLTPLHLVTMTHPDANKDRLGDLMRCLLHYGANPRSQDIEGNIPLCPLLGPYQIDRLKIKLYPKAWHWVEGLQHYRRQSRQPRDAEPFVGRERQPKEAKEKLLMMLQEAQRKIAGEPWETVQHDSTKKKEQWKQKQEFRKWKKKADKRWEALCRQAERNHPLDATGADQQINDASHSSPAHAEQVDTVPSKSGPVSEAEQRVQAAEQARRAQQVQRAEAWAKMRKGAETGGR